MVNSDEYQKKTMANMNGVVVEESEEEKLLWEKRTLLEKKIERKMKMIHNGREWLDHRERIGVFERVVPRTNNARTIARSFCSSLIVVAIVDRSLQS
jgi:hypothetical protein